MTAPRAKAKPATRLLHVTESLPPGHYVKGAGVQLARLFGEELLARLRARQRAAAVDTKGVA